MKEIKKVSKWP